MRTFFRILITLFLSSFCYAQPSLLSEDIDEIPIIVDGNEESYTLIRDAIKRNQWYYIPNSPRLSEIKIENQLNPEISLLRYQFVDESLPNGMSEGGIVQFSVSLNAKPQSLLLLRNYLEKKLASESSISSRNINLSPLPLKSANATIYSPKDNTIVSNVFGTGSFPIFASQKAPFVLYLTKQGSDINDALIGNSVSGNTGIPIVIEFTFHGLTPPSNLRIKANYRKIFKHYSEDKVFAAKASYFGYFGGSSTIRWTNIKEKLEASGALTVEKISNEEISEENMDAVMQGVMKRINDNIIQIMSPPQTILPASAENPRLRGRFGGAGYNATFKKVELISELDDEFIWSERKIVERKTLAGGFIGIGHYPEEIRKRVVQFVPGFNWQSAHFILPTVNDIPDLTQITIKTDLIKEKSVVSSKTAVNRDGVWKSSPGNKTISTLDYAIAPLINNDIQASDLSFNITTSLIQAGKQIVLNSEVPVVNGSIPVAPPSIGISSIVLDPSDLHFKNIESNSTLLRVQVMMQINDEFYSKIIQPKLSDGVYSIPHPITWVVKKTDILNNPIKIQFKFDYSGSIPSKTIIIDDAKKTEPSLNILIKDPSTLDY